MNVLAYLCLFITLLIFSSIYEGKTTNYWEIEHSFTEYNANDLTESLDMDSYLTARNVFDPLQLTTLYELAFALIDQKSTKL